MYVQRNIVERSRGIYTTLAILTSDKISLEENDIIFDSMSPESKECT
jgi:hypothetical protein